MPARTPLRALLLAALAVVAVPSLPGAAADEASDAAAIRRLRDRIDAAGEAVTDALAALAGALPAEAVLSLARADAEAAGAWDEAAAPDVAEALGRSRPRTVRALERMRTRLAAASAAAGAAGTDVRAAARRVRSAAAAVVSASRPIRLRGGEPFELVVAGGRPGTIGRPGVRRTFRVVPMQCADDLVVSVRNDTPGREAVTPTLRARGRGRFVVRWGSDLGTATLDAAACGAQLTVRLMNLGVRRALRTAPPAAIDPGGVRYARDGAETPSAPVFAGDGPFDFTVDPPLPDGLALDPATGSLTGIPTVSGPATTHRVTASNLRGAITADVVVDVDPALPAGVTQAADGFAVELVADQLSVPVKLAPAPDGRILFSELFTGAVREIDASGALVAEPLVTVPVALGVERGLQGIALAPDFAASGEVYVFASTAAGDGQPERNRVLRYTLGASGAAGPDVILDDLPIASTQNGGGLAFGPDGMLYVTTGDAGDEASAQDDGSLAGRVLRVDPEGGIPAGNPIAASPEWARGFRNPFGIAFSPVTGDLFVTENGPDAHDELDFVQPGKNFGWGAEPDAHFGALTGIRVIDWTPVIAPTGIALLGDDTSFGAEFAGNAFVGSYDGARVVRIVLSGIDFDSESVFVQFDEQDFSRKPLDVVAAPDGAAIYRVRRD